jgi:hypothetical protein
MGQLDPTCRAPTWGEVRAVRAGMEETAVRILSSLYNADTNGIYATALNFAEFVEALQRCWAHTTTREGAVGLCKSFTGTTGGGEHKLVAQMKAALESRPKLKPGFWGDDEKFHEFNRGGAVQVCSVSMLYLKNVFCISTHTQLNPVNLWL